MERTTTGPEALAAAIGRIMEAAENGEPPEVAAEAAWPEFKAGGDGRPR